MPGLFGIIRFGHNRDQAATDQRIAAMCDIMCHTPEYVVQVERFCGHQSATVGRIDLPVNCDIDQPVSSKDGTWIGFLYGEVYDDAAKRKDLSDDVGGFDTENDAHYILELYLARGRDALAGVSGTFVAVFVEKTSGKVAILTDRHAFLPLYYALSNDEIIFAPEIKGLLAAKPALRKQVDWLALAEFLAVAHPLGARTLFEDVKVLPPATECIISDGTLQTAEYWDLRFSAAPELETREAQRDAASAAMQQQIPQISLHRTQGLQVGALLSGGMDSRVIVGLVAPHRQISTHHFGIDGCPDTPRAHAVARSCGTDHHVYEIKPERHFEHWPRAVWITEGQVSCYHFHHSHLGEPISEISDVLLNGQTTFSSVPIKDWMLRATNEEGVLKRHWNTVRGDAPPLQDLFAGLRAVGRDADALERAVVEDFKGLMHGCRQERVPDWCQSFYIRNRLRRLISYAINMQATRMRVKIPFFGNTLVDTTLSLPVEARYKRRAYIDALRITLPELAEISCSTDLSDEARGVIDATAAASRYWSSRVFRKLRYMGNQFAPSIISPIRGQYPPYGHYLRTIWREHAEGLLMADDAPLFQYVNRDAVRDAWQAYLTGKRDHGYFLHQLFTISLWHEMFVDQRPPSDLEQS